MASARLLIVEDDDRVRAPLRLASEDEGYDVAESTDAEGALTDLVRCPPDVMLVDLMLGGMDGFSCIREVRRDHDLPIIVLSALSDSHDIVLEAHPHEPLVLSPASATVRRGDRDLCLTLTEYRLLCELANPPGQVLSRRTLLAVACGYVAT